MYPVFERSNLPPQAANFLLLRKKLVTHLEQICLDESHLFFQSGDPVIHFQIPMSMSLQPSSVPEFSSPIFNCLGRQPFAKFLKSVSF